MRQEDKRRVAQLKTAIPMQDAGNGMDIGQEHVSGMATGVVAVLPYRIH